MSLQQATTAANRFGLGARPGELAAAAGDSRGWLLAQLRTDPRAPSQFAGLRLADARFAASAPRTQAAAV